MEVLIGRAGVCVKRDGSAATRSGAPQVAGVVVVVGSGVVLGMAFGGVMVGT